MTFCARTKSCVPLDTTRRQMALHSAQTSKRVPDFPHDKRGGKQASPYFGQEIAQGNCVGTKPWGLGKAQTEPHWLQQHNHYAFLH